jgi:hypothetical protein
MNFSLKRSAAAPSAKFCCNVWNFIHMFFLFILYQRACEYVANTSSKFQMVGPTCTHPNGFGGASGRNDLPPPPPPNMTPMEAFMVAQAEVIHYLMQHQQPPQPPQGERDEQPRVAKWEQFAALKPPIFSKADEPLEADAWIRAIEAKLDVLTLPCSEERKASFAAQQLRGPALIWWDHYKMMQEAGHAITWDEFKRGSKEHHIPKGMVERKLNKLLALKQESDSVFEYAQKFNNLCQYGGYHVDMDEKKMDHFRRGLDEELYERINPIKTETYHELVDLAISQEDAMKRTQKARLRKAAFTSNNAHNRKF